MSRTLTYIDAIKDAMQVAMRLDSSVFCYGLGVDDPRRIFGSTQGLVEEFGPERVFDMPTAENGMTGVGIGAAIAGMRPVMVHQRLDFFLYAMDQLVNGAAKWHTMFGGVSSVPLTIRLIIGHGWGQGPTHCQSLQAWFAHIPGLKVVMPTSPADARGLLLESIFDDNPVVILEHRWLHNTLGEVPDGDVRLPIGKARVVREGKDISLVALSFMTIEALHAARVLSEHGIEVEVVDICSIRPLDKDTILESVRKTGKVIALDTAGPICSVASEVVAMASIDAFASLKSAPRRITQPDHASPTSFGLTKEFYRRSEDIVDAVADMFGKKIKHNLRERDVPHDVPGDWFRGPF